MAAVLELEQNCREDALKILISISDSKPYGKCTNMHTSKISYLVDLGRSFPTCHQYADIESDKGK